MRAESFVNKQLRLLLEQQTGAAFNSLIDGPLRFVEFTLIGYDFGPEGNVAYKTTLRAKQLAPLVRGLLDRWASGTTRVGSCGDRDEVVNAAVLQEVNDKLRRELPPGLGFSLLIGSKFCTAYISNAEREDVIVMLGKLANSWEQEAHS